MQTILRRLRSLNLDDEGAQERLKSLTTELRTAVQDRFEQLELLPFRKP
jgi:signal transduction histidine kinase